MGTSENNGKTFLLYLLARSIVNLRNLLGRLARAVLLAALALGGYWSVRLAWADALFRRDTEASVREAARIVPSNAEYHVRLAAILDGGGDAGAEQELRKTVAASPCLSSAWIELGLRAENAGTVAEAESDLVRAARMDRRYSTLWTLANFYFRHNQGDKFWPVARRALRVGDVVAYDPAPLFGLCWKLSRDPDTILNRAIPDVGAVQSRYLEFLVRENLAPAAEAVTERVVAMSGERELSAVYEYCDRLIAVGDAERAIHAWNALCWRTLRGYRPLAPEAGVSLTNGDFSAAPVEHGFDWRLPATEGVTVERAGLPPRLWITLDGHEPETCDLAAQALAVAPARKYRLRFRYQTDGLAASSGVRWRLMEVAGRTEIDSDAVDLASEQDTAATVSPHNDSGRRVHNQADRFRTFALHGRPDRRAIRASRGHESVQRVSPGILRAPEIARKFFDGPRQASCRSGQRQSGHLSAAQTPMKILQCVGDIDPALGGSVEAARQLSHALHSLGHNAELLTARRPKPEWIAAWKGAVHCVGPAATRYLYSPHLAGWMAGHAGRFDAIIIHGLWRYTSVGTWRALRRRDIPYFVFAHGMLDPYFKSAFRWKHVQKKLCWMAVESRVVRDATGVLFTCEEERLRARQTFRPYKCRERVVGLGIANPSGEAEAQKKAFLDAYPQLAGKRMILFLGRIHPKKGCDLLIEAFARVAHRDPLLRLVIAGPDECGWRAELEKLATTDRIVFTGPLYGDLKWGALRSADVMALPSHIENFGITVAEALACGVPVLISNGVNIWREIEADGAGLVARADVEGVTSLLEQWLALPETERQQMGERAFRSFTDRFELERFARDFVACMEVE